MRVRASSNTDSDARSDSNADVNANVNAKPWPDTKSRWTDVPCVNGSIGRHRRVQRWQLQHVSEPIEAPPLLHPSMSDLYRQKVTHLYEALNGDERSFVGARQAIRGLIDEVSLVPSGDQLRIILKGNLESCDWPIKIKGRRRPTTSWTKYCWLRGHTTNTICSSGDRLLEISQRYGQRLRLAAVNDFRSWLIREAA